jgi:hypothetical protein
LSLDKEPVVSRDINPFPEHRIIKFLDEATGLFWTGILKPGAIYFETVGVEYRHDKVAEEAFRNYEITRVGKPSMNLPVITKIVYRVELVELERKPFGAAEADMRLTRFALNHGKMNKLTGFVRQLHDHKQIMDYMFIIERNITLTSRGRAAGEPAMDLSALDDAKLSSRKSGKKYIAVKSDADLLYLKMSLGASFNTAYDLSTAKPVN